MKDNNEADQLIVDLRTQGMSALDSVYLKHRDAFLQFGRKYRMSDDDILDAYQDAAIAMYENAVKGRLTHFSSTVKTYLFSLGKYTLLNKMKKNNRTVPADDDVMRTYDEGSDQMLDQIELSHRQSILSDMLGRLTENCRELLTLFYYHRYTIDAIRHELGYKDDNVVKSSKSRCLKKLKELAVAHKNNR